MAVLDFIVEGVKIVGGGAIASMVTLYATGRRQDREVERAAGALAIRLVRIFESYTQACAEMRDLHLSACREDPYDYSEVGHIPDLPALPTDDQGWRALDTGLSMRVQSFHIDVRQSQRAVAAKAEYGDADDISTAVEREATNVGPLAWELSAALRQRYSLGRAPLEPDYPAFFNAEKQRLDAERDTMRAEIEENNQALAAAGIAPNIV